MQVQVDRLPPPPSADVQRLPRAKNSRRPQAPFEFLKQVRIAGRSCPAQELWQPSRSFPRSHNISSISRAGERTRPEQWNCWRDQSPEGALKLQLRYYIPSSHKRALRRILRTHIEVVWLNSAFS